MIAKQFAASGIEFVGLDVAPGPCTSAVGSVADRDLVESIMGAGIDAVVHSAALHKPQLATRSAAEFVEVNVVGTLNLLEAALRFGVDRFVMTSTTSVMVTQKIHEGGLPRAVFLDESTGPLEPRNLYGVTKLAAEGLCRAFHLGRGLSCIVLRTSRFFPEDDDSDQGISGPNLKANELLYRRLSVEDAARAHLVALDRVEELGFDLFVLSGPTPFQPSDAKALVSDASKVISTYFPDAPGIYDKVGWQLPRRIERVYDSARAQRVLGFTFEHDFAALLAALKAGDTSFLQRDASYKSPVDSARL
jgi:nucleoside-diphosphate-sugar epimerase